MSKKLHELVEKTAIEGNEYVLIDDSNGEGDSKKLPVSAIIKPLSDKYEVVAKALEETILEGASIKEDMGENTTDIERLKYYGDANIVPTNEGKFNFWMIGGDVSDELVPYGITGNNISDEDVIIIPYKYSDLGYVVQVMNAAFYGCSATTIILPNTIYDIGSDAFMECRDLKSMVIPEGVSALVDTFRGCTNLESVVIPDSVTYFSETFDGCDKLIITCGRNSAAERYAEENGIPYKYSDCLFAKLNKAKEEEKKNC